ncbi:MAG: TIGR03032 family protein [Bacteroidetes bacterium]|nr:TIGR03032 family protein [Bacteroidota bacterium]
MLLSSGKGILNQVPISFKKPMGIAIQGSKLAVACIDEIQLFSKEEQLRVSKKSELTEFDTIYLHRATYHTGILDLHDLEFGEGMIWGVNTLFSCLAVYDINFSFRPKWKPSFITSLIPEDNCHLNGMAMQNDLPKYVTSLSKDDSKQGWIKNKLKTGVLMEVPSGEIILEGLSMPHSPRLFQDNLYVLESGNGNLIKVSPNEKKSEVIFNFNCFIRGLSFFKNYALIGKSKIRETSRDFDNLDVKVNSTNAGLIFFDMNEKKVIGEINYESDIEEIFDVQILENTENPVIITSQLEKVNDIITFPGNAFWKNEK